MDNDYSDTVPGAPGTVPGSVPYGGGVANAGCPYGQDSCTPSPAASLPVVGSSSANLSTATVHPTPGTLPLTGDDSVAYGVAGLGLLVLGTVIVTAMRRRRRTVPTVGRRRA